MNKWLFLVLLLLLSSVTYASDVQVQENSPDRLKATVTSFYIMGDGDSRVDARKMALEIAKQRVAEMAGSYIQAETKLENGQITEKSITTFAAAVMSSVILEEKLTVDKNNRAGLSLTVQATVDKKALRSQIAALDPIKSGQLAKLEEENRELKAQLAALTQRIHDPSANEKKELVSQRDNIISRLEENRGGIQRVFESGDLLQMAISADALREKAYQDIQENFFGYIQRNLKLTPGIPSFSKLSTGLYRIELPVQWSIDTTPLRLVLDRYFALEKVGYRFEPKEKPGPLKGQMKSFIEDYYEEFRVNVSAGAINGSFHLPWQLFDVKSLYIQENLGLQSGEGVAIVGNVDPGLLRKTDRINASLAMIVNDFKP